MDPPTDIIGHYEERYDEDDRLARNPVGRLELLRTRIILDRYLPEPPATILDVGGGPGIYAAVLNDAGYDVELIDIVPVDWVADTIVHVHLAARPGQEIYHLSAGEASETYAAIKLNEDLNEILDLLKSLDSVLKIMDFPSDRLTEEEEILLEKRELARREKDWTEADRLRDELKEMGVVLVDGPEGTRWYRRTDDTKG